MVDRGSAVPPWRQVAEQVRAQIETGELQPGAMLSIVTMAQEYGIARNTARKVLAHLRDAGLVEVTPGWGTFVRGKP
jgi:GntR family transcriptional regulator